MAVIAQTALGAGKVTAAQTTLGASDTLLYNGERMVLTLRNATAGALTPTITGSTATTLPVPGYGSVSVAGGYAVGSLAAGAVVAIPLDSIKAYLKGVITVTGGTGIIATLTNG